MKTKSDRFGRFFVFGHWLFPHHTEEVGFSLQQKRLGLLSPLAEIDSDFQDDRLDVMMKRNGAVVDREPT
jgi:hypothetical protein